MKTSQLALIALSLCQMQQAAQADNPTLVATSGKAQVQLLELYSSESCSSCPPADKWVSELKTKPDLWKNFVPIVFHVDYWNHLGWKDNLSSSQMTKRQRDVSDLWPEPSVYTPAMVVNGKEWRGWRQASDHRLPTPSTSSGITLSIYKKTDGSFAVKTVGLKDNHQFVVRMAVLGMNIDSTITGGENSGLVLQHNFVVLDWDSKNLDSKKPEDTFRFKNETKKAARHAIAAWIEETGNPTPLQAVGGYL